MSKANWKHRKKTAPNCHGTASAELRVAAQVMWLSRVSARAVMVAGLLALPQTALAEKSDKDKPVNIEADRLTMDDMKKESVFEGNVTVTQGTLTLKADKVVVKQDASGFNYAFAYGKPAHFRQKREGYDEYIEGHAERLEYDGKADKMQMFTAAEIRKGIDQVQGDYISYDAVTEFYQVIGGPSVTTAGNPKGRVRATIQPPKNTADKPGASASGGNAQPVPLKPSGPLRNKLEE